MIEEHSLINLLKTTKNNNNNSLVSFKDNASVIRGTSELRENIVNHKVTTKQEYINYSYKAETHNFPMVLPFHWCGNRFWVNEG